MTKSNHTPLKLEVIIKDTLFILNSITSDQRTGYYNNEVASIGFWTGGTYGQSEEVAKKRAALIVHRVNNWDKLVEALEFYADEKNWSWRVEGFDYPSCTYTALDDQGAKAKQALAVAKEGE